MPTESQVKKAIETFWSKEDEYLLLEPEEFIAALPEHLLPLKGYLPPVTLTEKQWIYRARPLDANYLKGDARNLIANYSYSPKKYTYQGRANHPRKPMFYGSEDIGATAFESRWEMEKDALVGCWRVKTKAPNIKLAVCASRLKPSINVQLESKLHPSIMLQLKFLDKLFSCDRERKIWTEIKGGIETKKETPKDKIHKLSASITQYLIERENVDGILYHSAQAQGAQAILPPYDEPNYLLNCAISPNYVDKYLVLEKIYRVSINCYYDDQGRKRAIRQAIKIGTPINEQKILFTNLRASEKEEFNQLHNSVVPMLLKGSVDLKMPRKVDIGIYEQLVKSPTCKIHQSKAELDSFSFEGVNYIKVKSCCNQLSEVLKGKLQSEGLWWD